MSNWREGGRNPCGRAAPGVRSAALLLALAGCGGEHPQSTIAPHSDFAAIIHSLYVDIFWWTMVILAVVWVGVALVVVKFRAKPGDPKPRQIRGHLGLEVGWTVGPALIVVAIAIPTIQAVFATQRPVSDDALLVEVTGHRFWWEFHYPEQGVTTANELWLPVDRPVSLRLASSDVIHSFWVPLLGGKRDVNPIRAVREGQDRRYNWLHFTPQRTGRFMGQCAEFCGESHAFMGKRVVVATAEEFEAWVRDWHAPPLLPPAPAVDPEAFPDEPPEPREVGPEDPRVTIGRETFMQSTCVACHAIQGTAARGVIAPDLTLFGRRATLAAGILENNEENLVRWITDPHAFKPAAAMPGTATPGGNWPPTGLSEEQVRSVAAYLLSLR
jgi:cytochrome c oxidase subunit II